MKSKALRIVLSVLLGAVCLGLWFHFVDPGKIMQYVSRIHPGLVALSALSYLVTYFLRSLRWNLILSTIKDIPPFHTFGYYMASNFLNYIIPIRAGEVAKCLFLKKRYDIRVSRSLPTVFVDKLFDSMAIFLVLVLIPFLPITLNKSLWILIYLILAIVAFGLAIMVAASIAHEKTTRFLMKLLFFIPQKYNEKLKDMSQLFVEGIGLFRHHMNLLPRIGLLTIMPVVTESLFILLLFWAFGVKINFFIVLFGNTLIYLSYILPHPPAQIGSNELLMVLIFSVGFGFDRNLVSAVMAFGHLMTGMLIVIIGVSVLSWTGVSIFGSGNVLKDTENSQT